MWGNHIAFVCLKKTKKFNGRCIALIICRKCAILEKRKEGHLCENTHNFRS